MAKKDFTKSAKQAFGGISKQDDGVFSQAPTTSRAQFEGTKSLKGARYILIEKIRPDENQPRKNALENNSEPLHELADSIKEHGVLQPIIVQYINDEDYFRIMFGERRYHASKIAGLTEMPCIIKQIDNETKLLAQQFIENIHREDLSPIDKARGLLELKEKMGSKTQWKDVEAITGLHTRRRQQFLALLDLPDDIQKTIVSLGAKPSSQQVTEGHARALLKLKTDEDKQRKLFEMILNGDNPVSTKMAMDIAKEMSGEGSVKKNQMSFKYESIPDLINQLKRKIKELENTLSNS